MRANRLRPLGFGLLALAAASAPAAAQLPAVPAGSRAVESRHALPPDGFLRLWNLTGSVRILGWERDSVVVTGDVPEGVDFFCGVVARGEKCAVNVPMAEEAVARPAHLEVRVPRRAAVWVKSAGADISIAAVTGDVEAYSVTGAIRVDGHAHVLQVETMGGDISVSGSAESLRARTAAGAITLAVDADDADVSSVAGPVRITRGAIRQGRIESIDGGVHWSAAPAAGARLELTSHTGAIDLRLPAGAGGVFAVNSYRGDVACTVPGARRHDDRARRETTFTLPPAGDARLTIRSFKGAVTIERAPAR